MNTQIPDAIWVALVDEAEASDESVARVLARRLQESYRIPDSKIPKPKRVGRKPKKR